MCEKRRKMRIVPPLVPTPLYPPGPPMGDHEAQDPLFTWKLSPLKLLNSRWALSKYRGKAYVRAPTEIAARRLAAAQFAGDPSAVSPNSPWLVDAFTTVEV